MQQPYDDHDLAISTMLHGHDHPEGGYWCVVCMRFIPLEEDGETLIHDSIPHPPLMDYDEDYNPQ